MAGLFSHLQPEDEEAVACQGRVNRGAKRRERTLENDREMYPTGAAFGTVQTIKSAVQTNHTGTTVLQSPAVGRGDNRDQGQHPSSVRALNGSQRRGPKVGGQRGSLGPPVLEPGSIGHPGYEVKRVGLRLRYADGGAEAVRSGLSLIRSQSHE